MRPEAGVGDVVVGAPEEDVGREHGEVHGGGVLAGHAREALLGGVGAGADGGAAERAGVVGVEPHVDALHVEAVAALGQRAHLLAVGHLGQAHGALERVGFGRAAGRLGGAGEDRDGEGAEDGGREAAARERGVAADEEEAGGRGGWPVEHGADGEEALGVEVEEEDEDDDHEEEDHRREKHPVADGQLRWRARRGRRVRRAGDRRRRRRRHDDAEESRRRRRGEAGIAEEVGWEKR